MEQFNDTQIMDYNTGREKLVMPEYGRNVLKMAQMLRDIEDKDKRTQQARAIVKSMEILNPAVHQQDNYEQKLWDHLYMIAGFDIDVDAPYPAPVPEMLSAKPLTIPIKNKPVKATHYGRNIESIIDLIAEQPVDEVRTAMIRSLATYMRQQYLIWNKDSVADETIFKDIEKLSEGRIKVPEGLSLSKLSFDASFSRPGMNVNVGQPSSKRNRNQKNNWKNKKK